MSVVVGGLREGDRRADEALSLVRALAPADFPENVPLYVVPYSDLPMGMRPSGLRGCFWPLAGAALEEPLRRAGRWRGAGHVVLVDDGLRGIAFVETALHEATHVLIAGPKRVPAPVARWPADMKWILTKERVCKVLTAPVAGSAEAKRAEGHGADFLLLGLALLVRARRRGLHVSFKGMALGDELYGLSKPNHYLAASLPLVDAWPQERPLVELLAEPLPAAFRRQWMADTGQEPVWSESRSAAADGQRNVKSRTGDACAKAG